MRDIVGTLRLFRRKEIRPSELMHELLERIAHRAELHAFACIDRERALQAAHGADQAYGEQRARPLEGIPISVKDNFDVEGLPTGNGHSASSPEPKTSDSAMVKRLRDLGAIILGKTHMHECALGISGRNDRMGTPKNPHDPTRLPGGSSSGAAVSVASGLALAALGSDTGGSVRVPAALCGCVGFKPTFGALPTEGLFPLAASMDHAGLLLLSARDAVLLHRVLTATDPPSANAAEEPPPHGPRVRLVDELMEAAHPDISKAIERTSSRWPMQVERCSIPDLLKVPEVYGTLVSYEAFQVHGEQLQRARDHYGHDVRALLEKGSRISQKSYQQAMAWREHFRQKVGQALEGGGLLATPTTLSTAPRIEDEAVDVVHTTLPTRLALLSATCPFSMIGIPAISLPVRMAGLPAGLQLVAGRGQDGWLCATAEVLEASAWPGETE